MERKDDPLSSPSIFHHLSLSHYYVSFYNFLSTVSPRFSTLVYGTFRYLYALIHTYTYMYISTALSALCFYNADGKGHFTSLPLSSFSSK